MKLQVISPKMRNATRYLMMQVDFGKIVCAIPQDIRRTPKHLIEFLPFVAQQVVLRGCEGKKSVSDTLAARLCELLPEGIEVECSS